MHRRAMSGVSKTSSTEAIFQRNKFDYKQHVNAFLTFQTGSINTD